MVIRRLLHESFFTRARGAKRGTRNFRGAEPLEHLKSPGAQVTRL